MSIKQTTLRLVFLLLISVSPAFSKTTETGFLDRMVIIGSVSHRYQVYIPEDFNPRSKWPVILFLHGIGARGSDGLVQTAGGIGDAIRRNRDRFHCIIVFPQASRDSFWYGEMETLALKALDQAVEEFNGDPQRIYLTGLSMGGRGAWYLAARHPDRFAALVPICGGIAMPSDFPLPVEAINIIRVPDPYSMVAKLIGNMPIWVFHGADDAVVPVTESRTMVAALKANGGNVKYTEYAGVGHNSWEKAYALDELYSWLFAQRLLQGKPKLARPTRLPKKG